MKILILASIIFLSSCQISRVYDLNNYKAPDFDSAKSEWKEFKKNLVVCVPGKWDINKIYGYQQMLIVRCTKNKHKKLKLLLKAFWIDSKIIN
jgi:hypothetical protein